LAEREQLLDALRSLAGRRDDEQAWGLFYRLVRPYVYALCARALGKSARLAEDACQEVFLRIARFAPFDDLADSGNMYPYVRIVCRSVCSDLRRRWPSHEQLTDIVGAASSDSGVLLQLHDFVRGLSEDEVRLLHCLILGLTTEEMAKELSVTYSTISVRVHRLRAKLKSVGRRISKVP
jgi:RNA polymerase sigma factor (sigma-70 family)